MPPKPKLTPDQQRIRVIVVTLPVLIATSAVLVKRMFLGEEQRKLKPDDKLLPKPA